MLFRKDFWQDIYITYYMYMLGIYGFGKKKLDMKILIEPDKIVGQIVVLINEQMELNERKVRIRFP